MLISHDQKTTTLYVDNEITQLKKVIVHFPDEGISRISPRRAEELLFDDIVFYPLLSEEYRIFQRILRQIVGDENVWEIQDLIKKSVATDRDARNNLIAEVIDYEELPSNYSLYLEKLDDRVLAKTLITGYLHEEDLILFDPIPNFLFTRDIAVVIKDHVIITKASKEARFRENILTKFIFKHHPFFRKLHLEDRIIDLNDRDLFPPSRRGESVCAEGGDIMVIDGEYVLIGSSERTNNHAFHSIKEELFNRNLVQNVVQVNIPNERSFMHIDTLFTRIDHDLIVCYKPIVYDGEGSNVIVHGKDGGQKIYPSIKDFALKEINPKMKFLFSGGGITPYQEREQWTDGCNLVCLKPGVAISYDRNLKTLLSFEKQGYKVIDAEDFFKYCSNDPNYAKSMEKTIITIPSSELSRARGGSHCMTCPIERKPQL